MIDQIEKTKNPEPSRYIRQLYIGIMLIGATIFLVYLLSTESFQRNNTARYVASFVAGLFGFTAIETLRRSVD